MTPQIKQRIDQIRRGEVPEGYKKMKSDIIPEEWTSYLLSDIYTERKESGIPSLPILTVSIHSGVSDGALDDDELGKKVKRIEDKTQYRTAHSGDLVFNMMRAWQGAIGVVRSDGLVSPAYIVATPDKSAIYPPFMDYYMKTPQMVNRIHRKSYGVTDFRLRLYWDSFAMIGCAMPPLPEQKKIAEILSAQDKLIALKEKLIEEKKRQKKYLMQQLLTGKKRLPGFSGEWYTERLDDFCLFVGGGTPDTKNVEYWQGDIPWISSSDLRSDDLYNVNTNRYITNDAVQSSATKKCPAGSILVVTRVGVGKVAIAPTELCTSQDFTSVIQNKYDNMYIAYAIYWLMQEKSTQVQGSSIKGVPSKEFQNYTVHIPPINEQCAIVSVLSAIDREIDLLAHIIDQEKQKKKALMQLLLSGVVRVNV